ncbi:MULTISPECIES: hypothetical protein [unclassified Streptomyces]|uniref:hypothetical protein n=1 Tax=unclassified Streptomyces TaxID=2593676 RepID=UPI002251FAA6|nr:MULTISPECIES: hypothetical protein [unclassified Streptomyces]MCX4528993.1 hypothetical protein [Streptomyces sp. NBC_01551]MCX4540324.1 hypothetical protein [Streptomyces sp. NBC_01565]
MTQNAGWGTTGAPQWGTWAPQSPQPGVIPLRPLDLGEILSGAFGTIRNHWKQLVGVMLAVQAIVLPAMALAVVIAGATVFGHLEPVFDAPYGQDPAAEDVVPVVVAGAALLVVLGVIGVLGMAVFASLCQAVLREAVMGKPTAFRPMWRAAFRRTPAVAGAMVLTVLIAGAPVFAALAVCVPLLIAAVDSEDNVPLFLGLLPVLLLVTVPLTVWLNTRLALAPAAAVMEDASPVTALRRSAALVRGAWWRIFGITLLAGVIGGAVAWAIQMPFQFIGTFAMVPATAGASEESGFPAGLIAGLLFAVFLMIIGSVAGQMFQIVFTQLASGLLYVDQRIRREGLAEAILAEVTVPAPGATTPAAPQPRPEGPAAG